jgi:sulfonate transport system ATP-binding protein
MSDPLRPAAVSVRGVGHRFGAHTVLADIDLDIAPGEVIALVGASGSGKSTLLRLVAGLDAPTSGQVRVDGRVVRGIDPRCAVVFQEPRLLPWRTLAGNVALGLPAGTPRAAGRAEIARALAEVGLRGFENHRPRQVSGGMAQRAALARALVRRPGVLLLDEPFAALDALTRLRMQDLLAQLHDTARTTILLVTHDAEEAVHLADRVVVLAADRRESAAGASIGRILDVPTRRPRDRGDPELSALRLEVLARLGVPLRHPIEESVS